MSQARPAPVLRVLPEQLLTVTEVATALRMSKATVYKLCQEGRLPHLRIANAIRFRRTDVEAALP
jgi:excisionase family DNA binding protein